MAKTAKQKPKNEFMIIAIDDLPDGIPVFGVTELPNKDLARFHLVEKVLWPIAFGDVKKYKARVKPKNNKA